MATSGSVDSSGYQGRVLRFEWGTNSINSADNTRNIWYKITAVGGNSSYYYHHNETVDINGNRVYTGSDSHQVYTNDILASGSMTVNQSNTSVLTVEMHGGIYSRTDNINKTQSWNLDTIPRYANFTNHSISNIGLNNIIVNWNADSNCDAVQYSLNGGNWVTTSGTSYTISGLTPNTSYSIKTRIRRTDSGLWTESGTITGTTKDIGKITSVSNFEHGSSTNIVITNPSNSSLNLAMKIGNTQILNKSINAGTNAINFGDTELDNIYKLYGSGNTLTATFILTTAGVYTNSKNANITLTGNQKTAYITGKKRAKVYVGVNGTVKKAIIWIGNNGRKRCI